jgi:hypothetical protein
VFSSDFGTDTLPIARSATPPPVPLIGLAYLESRSGHEHHPQEPGHPTTESAVMPVSDTGHQSATHISQSWGHPPPPRSPSIASSVTLVNSVIIPRANRRLKRKRENVGSDGDDDSDDDDDEDIVAMNVDSNVPQLKPNRL